MAPSSPEGILIGNPRKPWRVGRKIGSGVCGTVHELDFHGKAGTAIPEVEYVIKIAPLPKGKTNPKKKKTEAEHNANLLYYENLMYMTQLPHLQGKLIARVPSMGDPNSPPFFGDEEGFRFIVMERMEAPMMDVVPALLDRRNKRAGGKIPFGPVAAALLDCVEALHEKNHLFVDMKTENFMLAAAGGRKRKTSSLADRVRMIDLGLVKPLKDVAGGHRTDEGADLIGTPLYASLNVHEGHTLSRRDDLEALGYVISELLIALIAASTGARSSKKKAAAFLPWSNGKSDDEIYKIKKKEVTDPKSTFYSRLGAQDNADVARIMRKYFKIVKNIGYKEEPDYESLRALLLELNVSGASTSKPAARAPKSEEMTRRRTTARGTKRTSPRTRRNTQEEDDEEEFDFASKPAARAPKSEEMTRRRTTARGTKRTSPRTRRNTQEEDDEEEFDFVEDAPSKVRRVASIDDDDSVQDSSLDDMEVEDDFHTCKEDDQSAESMEWDVVGDENHAPAKSNAGSKVRLGVRMMFTDGPHEGESFLLELDTVDTIVLGSNPRPKSGDSFRLSKDPEVDTSHAKLVLEATKQLVTVRVSDLKSSSGTFLNRQKIPKGKERRAFINDKISVGESTFQIQVLPKKKEVQKKKAAARSASSKQKSTPKRNSPKKSKLRGLGLEVAFIDGPDEGESFFLEKDVADTFVLGTKPVTKSGETFRLERDGGVDGSHARLELVTTQKLCTVKVTDLKSDSGTFVNGQPIPKGKHRRAFINDKIQVGDSIMQIKTA